MVMNLSDYNYSYANSASNILKQPLFKLISTIAIASKKNSPKNLLCRIIKIAFYYLMTAICIIPVSFSYLLGKMISHFSKTQINDKCLHLAPPLIQITKELEEDKSIDIRILSDKFNRLEMVGEGSLKKNNNLYQLCDWTATENANIYPDDLSKRKLFYKQLSIFLKKIIKKIDSSEISKDKEKAILIELAKASTQCYPTWLEVAAKLCAEVNDQIETVEIKLVRYIQDYKEQIILKYNQKKLDTDWHALNYVRNILGRELGLNTVLNQYDPYAGNSNQMFGKDLTKWLFLQTYNNVNRLVTGIQTMINSEKYDPSYYDFLVDTIKQKKIVNPKEFVAENFYDENYKLKKSAVNLMLKSIRVLK